MPDTRKRRLIVLTKRVNDTAFTQWSNNEPLQITLTAEEEKMLRNRGWIKNKVLDTDFGICKYTLCQTPQTQSS